ncbi:MAG: acetylglutamate kinase [Clostridiales bacterium]|nr:acetylglutamate kinase [Clostridiales bacterium]
MKNFDNKTIVVKYGGAAMRSGALKRSVCEDAAALAASGVRLVLVHGGGPELSDFLKRSGKESVFADGLRYTDAETIEAAVMVLAGKINKELVALIENAGARAAGICGVDGGLIAARKKTAPDLGFVGEITEIHLEILEALLGAGIVPVVASVALGAGGEIYNINADTAAGGIAAALRADAYITLSDIPGVLRDGGDPATLIPVVRTDGGRGGCGETPTIEQLFEEGAVTGGMIPKLNSLADAIRRGLKCAQIVDGRVPHALRDAAGGAAAGTKLISG